MPFLLLVIIPMHEVQVLLVRLKGEHHVVVVVDVLLLVIIPMHEVQVLLALLVRLKGEHHVVVDVSSSSSMKLYSLLCTSFISDNSCFNLCVTNL